VWATVADAIDYYVYRATTHEGEQIAVKVQRPRIRRVIETDLYILKRIAAQLHERLEWSQIYDLPNLVQEVKKSLFRELDFTREARHMKIFSSNLGQNHDVYIPKLYENITTQQVLAMELVHGTKLKELAVDKIDDRELLAKRGLRLTVKQILEDGFFHADPHPGNVLVNLETGEITYLDTGMVGELTVNQRMNLIQLLMVVRQGDVRGMAQIMMGLSKPFREVDEQAFYRDFERRVGRLMEYPSGSVSLSQQVDLVFDVLQSMVCAWTPS